VKDPQGRRKVRREIQARGKSTTGLMVQGSRFKVQGSKLNPFSTLNSFELQ